MVIRQILIIIYFCLLTAKLYGQESKTTRFLNLGYDRIGEANFIKVGYKISLSHFGEFETNFNTLTADIGVSPFDKKTFLAPGLTYNFYGAFYYVGLNTTYFIGDNKQDLRIAPQIGLTYFNMVNIGYSYYMPVNHLDEINAIGQNCVNISVSLFFDELNH